jgi:hypothetical protein
MKNKKKNIKSIHDALPPFEEAKLFSVPIEVTKNHLTIKLPRKTLKYLNIDKDGKLNVIPINNTLQILGGRALTLIPALDLENLDNQFVNQV